MRNQYLQVALEGASPAELIVRMYDGAFQSIERARAQDDPRQRSGEISRALAIVNELRGSLDFEQGGEIARNLEALYVFASQRLLAASTHGEVAALADAEAALGPLREAWRELARSGGGGEGTGG